MKVSGYDRILVRRTAGVEDVKEENNLDEEVEEEDGLDEEVFVDLPVVIVRLMELVKKMSLSWITDVGRLFEVVELEQGY